MRRSLKLRGILRRIAFVGASSPEAPWRGEVIAKLGISYCHYPITVMPSASAADGDASGLKNPAAGDNLGPTGPSIRGISE
jgi:hypothetical protein